MKWNVLYNPLSGNGNGKKYAEELNIILSSDVLKFYSMPDINNFELFFKEINNENIIISGGDGTLNYFINKTKNIKYKNDIYYFPTGTGNDFHNDVKNNKDRFYKINEYITGLPKVKIKNEEYLFLNGVGYGIDGYCCEEGDKIKRKTTKPVNYTLIAIKGLLYGFKPRNAIITIDGREFKYKKVWLAPTMNGRFYGGGMQITPNQDRLNKSNDVSLVILHDISNIRILSIFPTIYKGTHIKYKNVVDIKKGHHIKVKFDKPCALQIDGETILDVSEYEVTS